MVTLFGVFLLTLLVITAIGVLRAENLFAAVMLMGIYSLQMAAIFFILDAADVALTEAAVGAGVATVLLLSALALSGDRERRPARGRWTAMAVVSLTTLMVIYATFEKPLLGDPTAPVHQHVAPWYLEETPKLIDVPNVVTAILASFRGYDTLGELFVIFTAGTGVLFLLASGSGDGRLLRLPSADAQGLRHHLVPRVVGGLLVPFIVLFGLYVQFHGDFGPGGGFQAGALITAGLILYALIEGEAAALRVVSYRLLTVMFTGGALLFVGVGVAGMLLGGNFLDYSVLGPDPIAGQHLGILLVELGVGLTVTGVLLTIFHAFAAREQSS
jgi:multicomponent Na+:H+ antiporter subunit B